MTAARAQVKTKKPPPRTASRKPPAKSAYTGPSTLGGIFTDEQADRGGDLYAGSCRSCHTPASHTGATFRKYWEGRQLSDLFAFVQLRMPKNNPGSLDPYDVADVVAYLLKLNGMPAGQNDLPPDADSLKVVRIVSKHSGSSPATRTRP
jgi:Cytochrome C oxidase, cbb3-type, subunit III